MQPCRKDTFYPPVTRESAGANDADIVTTSRRPSRCSPSDGPTRASTAWSKGPHNRYGMINARAETLTTEPGYRNDRPEMLDPFGL
jgi:putative SOS response-associated peptidase YedK